MKMEQLLSGFIGALIATIFSIFYHHITERKKLRSDVMLELVGYFDDIYVKLQAIHVDKDAEYTNKKRGLSEEEYRRFSRELKDLLNTQKIGAKLEIVYGEGETVARYNRLKVHLWEATLSVWEGTEANWQDNNRLIHDIFRTKIDPFRKDFKSLLIRGTRAREIIKDNDYAFSSEKVIVVVSTQAVRSRSNICDSQNRRLKR